MLKKIISDGISKAFIGVITAAKKLRFPFAKMGPEANGIASDGTLIISSTDREGELSDSPSMSKAFCDIQQVSAVSLNL